MILAAVAALSLASCAKIETNNSTRFEGELPIGFTTYSPKSLTKADANNYASSTLLINDADFDVYAWSNSYATEFTGTGTTFMNWYTVTYQTGGNSNGNSNAYPDGYRYWPSGDEPNKLSFYAYYPSDAGTITPPSGLGNFSFTAESTAAAQVDFMVADVVADQLYSTNSGTVALNFKHMLTKVQVKFKTTAAVIEDTKTNVVITGATLKDIKSTGTLAASYLQKDNTGKFSDEPGYSAEATPLTRGTKTAWTATSNPQDYTVYYPTTALTAEASAVADANVFLMVPQTMLANNVANAQAIEVSWDVKTYDTAEHATANGAEGLQSTVSNTKTLYLDDCKSTDGGNVGADIDWAKNNSVVYTITVGPQPILFTATVTGWDSPDAVGYYNVQ